MNISHGEPGTDSNIIQNLAGHTLIVSDAELTELHENTRPRREEFKQRQIDAAVQRSRDESDRYRQAREILRLRDHESITELVELVVHDSNVLDTFAALVTAPRTKPIWHIGVAGIRIHEAFYTLDVALLAVVSYRNGGGPNGGGHYFAARALGVSLEEPS